MEKNLKLDLSQIGSFTLQETSASRRNCENMIGTAQIPLGIVGPLRIKSESLHFTEKGLYLPLATTEGALVASVNRGCKAITQSGGVTVESCRVGATRGPVFRVENLHKQKELSEFLETHFEEIKQVAERTSRFLKLKKLTSRGVGKYRYVRFVFETQDAMGLNMVTIATEAIVAYLKTKTGITCVSLSGNFCVDKKPSWQNFINGRGIEVWAEVIFPASVLKKTLKTTATAVAKVWLAKCLLGSIMSGSMGFNAQYANVVAAIFAATGQDLAHIVEGSLGITTVEVMGQDLYLSVYLPDLMVGTVGGGTWLTTQKEALSILGVAGGNNGENTQKLAQIVGAAVLAGEISLLASLEEGSLVRAHQHLARGAI